MVKRTIMAARRSERDLARLREVALTGQESRENRLMIEGSPVFVPIASLLRGRLFTALVFRAGS
jgi:hypothetical protein